MTTYYRIQPAGLAVTGHRSEASDGSRHGLHVFVNAADTLHTDGWAGCPTDEVVLVAASRHSDNGDVEGVAVDPDAVMEIARYAWLDWLALWLEYAGVAAETDDPHWLRRQVAEEIATSHDEGNKFAAWVGGRC